MLEFAGQATLAGTHYRISIQSKTLELDGNQHLSISALASARLSYLGSQIQLGYPSFPLFKVALIPMGLGFTSLVLKTFQLTPGINDLIEKIILHSDTLINVACGVTYVALINLGCTTAGIIGLIGLMLIIIKRSGYLPSLIDGNMTQFAELLNALSSLIGPMPLYLKIIGAPFSMNTTVNKILNYPRIKKFLPFWITHPLHDKHVYSKDFSKVPQSFCVEPTHIYSNALEELFPADFNQKLDQYSIEELFDKIRGQCELNQAELAGLKNIETCVIEGKVKDKMPSDFEKFQKVIKALLFSIQNDPIKIKEFATIGNHCVEGWTREITFMFHPKSKDLEWSVHNLLAKRRDDYIQEALVQAENKATVKLEHMLGGANNIHLINNLNATIYHRFRTFRAELAQQTEGINLINSLYVKFLAHLLPRSASFFDNYYYEIHNYYLYRLEKNWTFPLQTKMDEYFSSHTRLIDEIYTAIKPQYRLGSDGIHEEYRQIPWDAITPWILKMEEHIPFLNHDGGWNRRLVKTDKQGKNFLTKNAVCLLLWNLGILTTSE